MTLAAVSDAGPLIHLAEIDSLELLATFDTLLVPETVYREVEAGGVPDGLADLSYEIVEADESRVGTEELDAGNGPRFRSLKSGASVFLPTISPPGRQRPTRVSKFTALSASSRSGTAVDYSIKTRRRHSCEHSSGRRASS